LGNPLSFSSLFMLQGTATMGLLFIKCQNLGGASRIVNRII
jgi:hypothetical protein